MVKESKTGCEHKGHVICALAPYIVIAISIYLSALLVADGLKEFRTADRYVTVKGLAEKQVKSDLASFNISFAASGDNLQNVYANVQRDSAKIKDFFKSFGIKEGEINLKLNANDKVANSYDGRNVNQQNRYTVNASFIVRTANIDAVEDLNLAAGDLISKGIKIGYYNTNYYFNGINEIKPELLSQAIAAAREAAKKFAEDSGSDLGSIRKANQGVISVLDESSNYGNSMTINKTVRVVSTVVYDLED